jgi:ABC-type multidrug transport system fused ATPase/permease subunit
MRASTERDFQRSSDADGRYAPSWLDRVTDGVRRMPVPFWTVYLVIGLGLSILRTAIGWIDGSYPVGTFFHVHVIDGLIPLYFVFVIHLLDDMAQRALSDYRAKLRDGGRDYAELEYRLTTLPFRSSLVVGILGLALGAIYIPFFLSALDIQSSHYLTSPPSVIVDTVLSGLSGLMMLMFAYHTIHQLRMISRIYTRHTDVSIFDIGPLYALSRVTAVTTVALLFFTYVYLAFYGNWQINSVSNGVILGAILLVALLTFIVPLYGAHRLLQKEKRHRQSEVARRLQATADALHARTDASDYSDEVDHIGSAIDGLLKERDVIAKAPTWPWEPEAVRAVITAVLLPIFIWILTRVLERFGV